MENNVEMYVMVAKGQNPYSWKATNVCSPIIKVQGGNIIEPEEISLEGMPLLDWLKKNPKRLKYNFDNEINDSGEFDYNYYCAEWDLKKIFLEDGECFNIQEPFNSPHFNADKRQYISLINRLEETFNIIEPIEKHKDVYGITFREIMLLAAMEVEVHWAALLKNNGYEMSKRLSTRDYVKLFDFIDFGSEFKLSSYPDFSPLEPFKNWDIEKPTASLSWYDAYNQVKHDRSSKINLATLENALLALAALRTMLSIRYTGFDFGKNAFDKDIFTVKNYPRPRYDTFGELEKQNVEYFKRVK